MIAAVEGNKRQEVVDIVELEGNAKLELIKTFTYRDGRWKFTYAQIMKYTPSGTRLGFYFSHDWEKVKSYFDSLLKQFRNSVKKS